LHWYFLFVFVFILSKFDFVSVLVGCLNDKHTCAISLSLSPASHWLCSKCVILFFGFD
jgi:hypothetical protein